MYQSGPDSPIHRHRPTLTKIHHNLHRSTLISFSNHLVSYNYSLSFREEWKDYPPTQVEVEEDLTWTKEEEDSYTWYIPGLQGFQEEASTSAAAAVDGCSYATAKQSSAETSARQYPAVTS